MGTVYAAIHPVIGKKVAINVLHPHVARQEEAVARFIQEARAVNAIGHPGIVDIFGFGRFVDGRHYITMEYLEGQQLLAYLNENGPIPPLHVLPLARQLAESLAAAHDKGVVHRDMKPENVFLGVKPGPKEPNPWPPQTKILDFGLAKLIEAEFADRKPRTRAGVTVGTPYYMSPEQCRGKAIDRRADVYALGVMMYEMVTGRVPFYAAESVDVLYMHLTQEPEAPSSHRPVPPEIEALILRCMAKTPEERPQDMHELMAELDAVMETLMPGDAAGERPEHELLEEAEAFFGLPSDPSIPTLTTPAPRIGRPDRITIPMAVGGLELPAEAGPGARAEPGETGSVEAGGAADVVADASADVSGDPRLVTLPDGPVKTYSKSVGHGVPSLPTPQAPLEALADAPAPVGLDPRPAPAADDRPRHPALTGFKTAITAVPGRYQPRSRALWVLGVAVVVLGLAVAVLAVLLALGVGTRRPASRPPAALDVDVGSVEVRSPEPVDVIHEGRPLARRVRRILVVRLPAGSTQVFVLKRADGSIHRATVRVAAARTVSVAVPPR
jgi:serine/threonine-protein kinase